MERKAPTHARIAFALAIFTPIYFAIAALGTRAGLWDFQLGLLVLTFVGGLVLVVGLAILAIVSLILILRKPPRTGWPLAAFALIVPLVFVGLGANAALSGRENPIHDVATDTGDPPQFSADRLAEREEADANPINDYSVPLGEIEMWEGTEGPLADKTHAEVIGDIYPDLQPVPLDDTERGKALGAIATAMEEQGLADIRVDENGSRVEGIAETFWFGFRDDVVARLDEDHIDLRSVSRVGQSDLGTNAERLRELRDAIAAQL